MKKIILLITIILGTISFGEKINTTGKSWNTIIQENKVDDMGVNIFDYHWLDEEATYNFSLAKSDASDDENVYLRVYYEEKPENDLAFGRHAKNEKNSTGYVIKEKSEVDEDEIREYYVAYYKIENTDVPGVYYVNGYFDEGGKKHSKLYFGFDEKSKKIVITDEKGNVLTILESYVAG